MLWIFATLVAAGAQTARNAMQSRLTATLGTLGATQVRFLYGLPFAAVFLALAAAIAGTGVPAPTGTFLAYTAGGAIAQIAGTALLLAAMRARSFSVVTAVNKTEAVQVAIFGVVLLGEHLTLASAAAIVVATAGVVIVAAKPGISFRSGGLWPVVYGIVSGGCFAVASQFWFLGFSLTAAANVRALGLVEVVFAHVVAQRVFAQRATAREAAGMALVVSGVALLLLAL